MDKAEFVNIAPKYYSLAIIAYLIQHISFVEGITAETFSGHYSNEEDHTYYVPRWKLFDLAVACLVQEGMIDVVSDPFGPSIISPSESFTDR
jgi:hypothetical protein